MKRPAKKILAGGLGGLALLVAGLAVWLVLAGPPAVPPSVTMPIEEESPAPADQAAGEPTELPQTLALSAPSLLPSPVDTEARLPAPPVAPPIKDDRPAVAILLTELGPSPTLVETILQKLPPQVSLAFLPFAAQTATLAQAAQKSGHELLVDIPMEPVTYPDEDPGPDALMSSVTAAENDRRLAFDLGRFSGYSGLVNYMGSRFTTLEDSMKPVLAAVKAGKLFYVDTHSNPLSVAPALARAMEVPFAVADLQLDAETSRETLDADLTKLEDDARRDGTALAVIAPSPLAIDRLALWAKSLNAKGLALVPVSRVTRIAP
jgi:polysaccharide deacetylase 2 family uncharacterized protein YibQ